jgi:hypothetical protein
MKNGTAAVVPAAAEVTPEAAVADDFDQLWREADAAAKTAVASGEVEPLQEVPAEAAAEEPAVEEELPELPPEEEQEPAPGKETRLWRKAQKEKLQQQFNSAADMLTQRAHRALAIEEAYKTRDFDALAKHLGKSSWSELVMEHLETEAEPGRRDVAKVGLEVSKLREQLEEEKAQLAYERQQADEAADARAYRGEVRDELLGARVVSEALAKDPEFIEAVVAIQQRYWNKKEETTIPAAQAAKIALDNLRKASARLAAYPDLTGEKTAAQTPHQANGGAPGTTPAQKRAPTAIPQRQGTDAASAVPLDELPEKEWFAHFTAELEKNRAEARRSRR